MQFPYSYTSTSHPNLKANMTALDRTSNSSVYSYVSNFPFPTNFLNMNVPMTFPSSLKSSERAEPMQANLYNTLVLWKLRNEYQSQLLKSQMIQLLEAQPKNTELSEPANNSPLERKLSQNSSKQEDSVPNQYLPELCDSNKSVKAHLKDIMYFVLGNFGTLSEEEFNVEKLKYRNNKDLVMVFDALLSKYMSAVKTREEMVKYTFRKAVKYMKLKMKREMKKGMTEDSSNSEKRNFKIFLEEMSGKIEEDIDMEEKDVTTKAIFPFKHGSKNTHISAEVISEAFSSENFITGFQEYLQNLDSTLELDNNKKIDKFVKFMEGSMKKNSIKDIKKFKRIPWLKLWIESTKRVAYELLYAHQGSDNYSTRKIIKKEEYISEPGSEGYSYDSFTAKIEETST